MVDQATAKYLSDNIGPVLSKALADMSIAQPRDGVDYLSRWLKIYAEQEEAKAWREREEKLLMDERANTQMILEKKSKVRKEKEASRKALDDEYESLMQKFNDSTTFFLSTGPGDGYWQELVDVVQRTMGVEAAYLGTLDGDIAYDCASAGSEWLKEKVLPPETGMTWGALTENPPEEEFEDKKLWRPPEELEPLPEPSGDTDEAPPRPKLKYYPVHVPCVTDEDRIHYFDMTRLGAYCAVPLVYTSYFNAEALEKARTYEAARKAEENAMREAQEAVDAAEAAGEEPPAEALEKLQNPVEAKELELQGEEVKRILCLDTLGTNNPFDSSKIPLLLALCKACGQCKSQTEMKQVDAQALAMLNVEERQQQDEDIKEAIAAFEQDEQAARDAEEADAEEEDEKTSVDKKYAYAVARKLALDKRELITELKSFVYVSAEVSSVVAATGLLFGLPKDQIYPKRKDTLQWEHLRLILDEPLFQAIEKTDLTQERKGIPPEQKLSFVRNLAFLADFDEQKAKDVSPAFWILFNLVQAGCNHRTAYHDMLKAGYQRRKAAADEAGEPFTEGSLAELDDDFEE